MVVVLVVLVAVQNGGLAALYVLLVRKFVMRTL